MYGYLVNFNFNLIKIICISLRLFYLIFENFELKDNKTFKIKALKGAKHFFFNKNGIPDKRLDKEYNLI